MAKKEIGKGFDNMFTGSAPNERSNEKDTSKEKLFCEISSDLKMKLQWYRIRNKTTIGEIVELALQEFFKDRE
jgi:hypothetical protein